MVERRYDQVFQAPTLEVVDGDGPRCIFQTRPARPSRDARPVGPIEKGWLNYQTYFPGAVREDQKTTPGTVQSLNAMERFIERVETTNWITGTCCCTYHANGGTDAPHRGKTLELETNAQELLRHGISVVEMNSSSRQRGETDDDTIAANIAEDHLGITPYAVQTGFETITEEVEITDVDTGEERTEVVSKVVPKYLSLADAAPLMARIAWEEYTIRCTDLHKISLEPAAEGKVTIVSTKRGDNPLSYAGKLKRLLGQRTMPELQNDRARVHHYGAVGSILYGRKSGPAPIHINSSSAKTDTSYDTFGFIPDQSILWTPFEYEEPKDGPKELGFDSKASPLEPDEAKLWPITVEEIAATLRRKLRLRPLELRWIDAHPEAYDVLREQGLVSAL